MAKRCEVCGKGPVVGRTVSHAHNVGPRRFEPNLQTVRALIKGAAKKMRVRDGERGVTEGGLGGADGQRAGHHRLVEVREKLHADRRAMPRGLVEAPALEGKDALIGEVRAERRVCCAPERKRDEGDATSARP